eukprot:gnl/TRDRNA2_/TRDRNA2_188338_c0_seq1.p1 gnl/TRDRNA2_/TRDRNA2_188338_c0~~gnl/TRDRNA2_/TRDRNA2_188338_c0_seq1.p1  ORF type:complete len:217 (+),score=50.18 gnl/TRDRNA2_/TRDRNA2_188338_c0_seq1:299-949(+)
MAVGKSRGNPPAVPTKDCVVCGKPFTWRKKLEKSWDEVLTCSSRCRSSLQQQDTEEVACVQQQTVADACEDLHSTAVCEQIEAKAENEGGEPAQEDDDEDEESAQQEAGDEAAAGDGNATRRARRQAMKAERRDRRARSPADKRKPCDLCRRPSDLLVRCTVDASQQWRMVCGRCWKVASGGVPDGDAEHPHYRYGGLWKNRSANVTTPAFGASAA